MTNPLSYNAPKGFKSPTKRNAHKFKVVNFQPVRIIEQPKPKGDEDVTFPPMFNRAKVYLAEPQHVTVKLLMEDFETLKKYGGICIKNADGTEVTIEVRA